MSEPASARLCHYRESALSGKFTLEIRAPTKKVLEEIKKRFPELGDATVLICNDRQFKLMRSGLDQDSALIAKLEQEGNIEREGEGVGVMLELLQNPDLSIDTRNTTEKQRVGWIKECIEQRPDLIEDIHALGIKCLLSTLGITTPNHIVEILLICAAVDPLMATEGLQAHETSFNRDQQLSIILACARTVPRVLDMCDLKNLSSPQRLEVALVCAKTLGAKACADGPAVAIWQQMPGFTLLDPQQKFEVIKLCAEIAPESTSLGLDALQSLNLDESQCNAIAKICLDHNLPVPGILTAIQHIRDPQERFRIAMLCAEGDPKCTARSLPYLLAHVLKASQCDAIAQICVTQPTLKVKEVLAAVQYIRAPKERLMVAMRCATVDPTLTARSLPYLRGGILNEQQCNVIAQICVDDLTIGLKDKLDAAKYLTDPKKRAEIERRHISTE